jgi:hypothetical protein
MVFFKTSMLVLEDSLPHSHFLCKIQSEPYARVHLIQGYPIKCHTSIHSTGNVVKNLIHCKILFLNFLKVFCHKILLSFVMQATF